MIRLLCGLGISILLVGTAELTSAQSTDRIRTTRPSTARKDILYGPLTPLRWAGSNLSKLLNRGLLAMEKKGFPKLESGPQKPMRKPTLRPVFGAGRIGAGVGGGLRAEVPIKDLDLIASARLSAQLYQLYGLSLGKTIGNFRTGPEGTFYSLPQEDYFGQGPDSAKSERTTYALQEWRAGWGSQGKWKAANLRHSIYVHNADLGPGRDDNYPITQEAFLPAEVDGGFTNSEWIGNHFGVAMDFRDNPADPRSGSALDVSVSINNGFNQTESNFATFRLTNYFYIPLSEHRTHLLALRSDFTRIESGDEVPFYVEPTLGGPGFLRGFREFRFRDRDSLAATIEYRYRIWDGGLDAVLFSDVGQVYSDIFREIDDDKMHATAGAGLKLNTRILKARLDVGHSHENTIVLLRFGQSW